MEHVAVSKAGRVLTATNNSNVQMERIIIAKRITAKQTVAKKAHGVMPGRNVLRIVEITSTHGTVRIWKPFAWIAQSNVTAAKSAN